MVPQVVHLHNHTAYSLQDGIARPQEMATAAAADGQPSLASTDHGTLAGIWRFAQAARAAGVKPICGMEGYLAIGSRHEQNVLTVNGDIGDADADAGGKTKRYHHLTMLAATPEGWRNLVRINNTAQREGFWYKPRFDWEVLDSNRGGIIYGTGCVGGPVASPILQGDLPGAKAALAALVDIAGRDNVFVEVMSHGVAEEAVVLPALVKLAREFGLPVVATNDAHYLCEDDAVAHDAWLAMGSKTTIANPDRFKFRGTGYHLRTAAQMHSVFDALPGCEQAVANTLMVAEKIDDNVLPESKMRLPHFKIPDGFPDAATYLKHLVREGAIKRYGTEWSQEITQRLRYEFDVIVGAGLEDYFLIVWDLVTWARDNGIRVGPGRGCLASDSMIWTPDGYKTISDIAVGDTVRTHTGALRKVSRTFVYDVDEPLVTIQTWFGATGVTMTRDHKVLIRRAEPETSPHKIAQGYRWRPQITSPTEWVAAGGVEVGDLMCIPRPPSSGTAPLVLDAAATLPVAPTGTTHRVTSTEVIERHGVNRPYPHSMREVAKATGVHRRMLHNMRQHSALEATGHASRSKRSESLSVVRDYLLTQGFASIEDWFSYLDTASCVEVRTPRHIIVNDEFLFLVGAWASNGWTRKDSGRVVGWASRRSTDDGLIPKLIENVWGLETHVNDSKTSDLRQWTIRSASVLSMLESLVPSYEQKAATKMLPEWVGDLDIQSKRALLRGLWWGDGCVSGGRWTYSTSSPRLLHQVRDLLWAVGAPAGVISDTRTDLRPEFSNRTPSWKIGTSPDFDGTTMRNAYGAVDEEYLYLRVRSKVDEIGHSKVYDFSVPVDHSFMTDSYVVHNSAAGAMLSYCLGITNIEPLANDLLFERFLNPERAGLPDVDIDFEAAHKTAVLDYLVSKYGADRVARLATYGMTRSRAAVKGATRALGLPTTLGDRLSRLIPVTGGKPMSFAGMDDAGSSVAAFHELVATDPDAARVVALARTIEDVPGNAGIHACGVIVSDTAFDDLGIPVRVDRKGSGGLVVDWDGKDAGDSSDGGVGLLKLDRLGLRNLDIVAACVESIKQTTGEDIDPDLIDPSADDERARATWAMLSAGKTAGIFQIESPGMTKLCEGMSPHSLNDLSALVALYRPGPMGAGMHDRYVLRKRGAEPVSYGYLTNVPAEIAVLESVLGSTYGVLAYQEQLQQLSKVVAGFTPGQSNKLLKAFAKKRREIMDALEEPFMTGGMSTVAADGAPKVAFRETTLRELWRTFKASSEYLFNRCLTGNTVVKNADGKCWTVESLYRASAADPTTCPMCGKSGDPFCGSCTVLAAWFDRDKIAPSVVKDVHDNGLQHVWTVRLVDGRQVTGTDNHRLLSTQGWTEIRDLRAGDRLMTEWSGLPAWTAIETIRYTGKAPTFDLEMADGTDHNFLANGIVSHNSHSAAYGQISYITAYLKANWTDLYCAALLAKTDNNDRRHAILSALREEGIAVLPPSVNLGGLVTGAENGCVRLGLSEIKDVGSNAAAVIAERDKNGPYSSLADLAVRSGVNAKVLGALIDSGACDEFGPRQGMFSVARAVRIDQDIPVPDLEWGILERAARERDRLGVCVTGHPVAALREQIAVWRDPRGGAVPMPVHRITTDHDGKSVSAVGVVASWSESAYSGGRRANFVLEGSAGELPCVMWNREVAALHKAGQVPRIGDLVAVVGQATVRTFDVRLDGRADDEVEDDDESTVTETVTRVEMRASRIVPVTVSDQGRQRLADVVPLCRATKPEPVVEVEPDEEPTAVVIELHPGKQQPDVVDIEVSFMDDELDSWLQTDQRWLAFMPCFRSSDMHRTFMNWLELCAGSPVPSPIYTAADGTRLRFVISEHADPDELKDLVKNRAPFSAVRA